MDQDREAAETPARGTALIIDLDRLCPTGKALPVLAAQVHAAGPNVRTIIAVAGSAHTATRYKEAAKELRVAIHVAKAHSCSSELIEARVSGMKRSGKFDDVVLAPAPAGRPTGNRLLLIDLENVQLYKSAGLKRLLAGAGPISAAVAVTSGPVSKSLAKACAENRIELATCAPGPDAADHALLAIARERTGHDGFVVASGDHIFTRLERAFDVVVPEDVGLSKKLARAAGSVLTFAR